MRYDFNEISKRIREMRKSKGMSQEKLIAEMKDVYNLPLARNTLSKIENGEESAYTFDFLYTFSKMFDCDIGYLLGEYNEKKQEIHQLCLATGLSEKAINKLLTLNSENNLNWGMDLINLFIESENFGVLLFYLLQYATYENQNIDYSYYTINTRDIAFTKIQDTIAVISKELCSTFEKTIKKTGDTRVYYSLLKHLYKTNKITKDEYLIILDEFKKGNYSCLEDDTFEKELKKRVKQQRGEI